MQLGLYNGEKARVHTKPLFLKSKILPLHYIYLLSVLSFMFKVYHEMLPPVIQHLFSKRHTISKYITRQTNTFQTPKTTTTLTKRSIIFQGPTEFNKLITDPNITLNTSIHTFKKMNLFRSFYLFLHTLWNNLLFFFSMYTIIYQKSVWIVFYCWSYVISYLTFEILLTYVPPKSLENGRYVLGSLVLLSWCFPLDNNEPLDGAVHHPRIPLRNM